MKTPPPLPSANSFYKLAATYSLAAPLVAIGLTLFQRVAAQWAIIVLSLTGTLLVVSALVLGIITLRAARGGRIQGISGRATAGVCVSGLLVLLLLGNIPSVIRQGAQKKAIYDQQVEQKRQ